MNILFLGDIVGSSGRRAVRDYLPDLVKTHRIDFVVANAENAAAGFGLTAKIAAELTSYGVDVLTTGNHAFDQKEFVREITTLPNVLRPANYPPHVPGRGSAVFKSRTGRRIAVINVMGRLFMELVDNPFTALDTALAPFHLGINVDAIIVDIHAEATSEKQILACYCDGRASLVVGTHTHVPTNDARLLPNGTAYLTDAGMCGDYDSIIGMQKDIAMARMLKHLPSQKHKAADGAGRLCGVLVTVDNGQSSPPLPIIMPPFATALG